MKLQDYYDKCILCDSLIENDKAHYCTFRLNKRYHLKSYIDYDKYYYQIDKYRTSKHIYRIVISKIYNPKEFKIYKYNPPHYSIQTIVDYKDFDLEFEDIYELINYSDKLIHSTIKNQIFI